MSLTIERIRQAQARIAPYTARTPLLRLQNLDESLGCEVYAKAECMQITGAFKLRGAMNKALTLTPEETIRMDGLMRFAKEEFDGAQLGFECILSAILTSILVLLARAYEREECDFKHNNAVLTSIEYIKQHYSEPLLARDLANRVFLSEATFYRVFKRATGQSFKSYLTMVRIRSACSLLKKRAIPITQVAYQCGYGNYSSFYRAFYQQMQMSPIQYLQET